MKDTTQTKSSQRDAKVTVSSSLPLIEIKGEWYDAGLIKKVSRSGNYTNVWIGQIGGCPKQVLDENSELLNRILAVRQ